MDHIYILYINIENYEKITLFIHLLFILLELFGVVKLIEYDSLKNLPNLRLILDTHTDINFYMIVVNYLFLELGDKVT